MRKRISFSDKPEAYHFTLESTEEPPFEIKKDTLSFSSNDFYSLFFKGLREKPEYYLIEPTEKLQGQAKHVFDTVTALLEKTCESIDADWFRELAEPSSSSKEVSTEQVSKAQPS